MDLLGPRKRRWRSPKEKEERSDSQTLRDKFFYFRLLVFIIFGVLTLQLMRMQVFEGEAYEQRARNNHLRVSPTMPSRGLIFDRNGTPLVENLPQFSAGIIPADFPKDREAELLPQLEALLHVPAADIAAEVDPKRDSDDPFTPVVIKEGLTPEEAFSLRQLESRIPGAKVIVDPIRRYTVGSLVSLMLGYVGQVTEDQYPDLRAKGYEMNDRVGQMGVEAVYESVLRGEPGRKNVEVDAAGREIQTVHEVPAKPGAGLVLSIDLDLQQKVTGFLQDGMGSSLNTCAIVMDVRSGDVLAMVSLPTYDDNIFTNMTDEQYQALENDPAKPMLNHCISETYPPGSTFKQVTGTGALQEGVANAGTTITSYGSISVKNEYDPNIVYIFKDWAALGTLNFYQGVAQSSDVYFYYLAGGYYQDGVELFRGMGARALARYTREYGLGAPTGIDLPGEADGVVPDPEWKERELGETWTIGDTYNFAIGQGFVTTSPLQMLGVTTAIANGGDVMVPRVVREVVDATGKTILPVAPEVARHLSVDDGNLATFREGMRQATSWGTATNAAVSGVSVAGKTGTAEFGPDLGGGTYASHAWFTGFAPAENPEVAVVVFLQQGNGAKNAAPIAGRILDYYFHREG
ncbi:MAG TPA: penicillin-binding protein 2 [Dehalococcoidia bacterium]|nr:penicillin-binding protein 2 [Dehalococcoidia bacterium]